MRNRMIFAEPAETVPITGKCVTINTDFRVGLTVRELWQDPRFSGRERLAWELTAALLFRDREEGKALLRLHPGETAEAILWYMNDGKRPPKRRAAQKTPENKEIFPENRRIFSCFWDEGLLYAAFLSVYGIDLARVQPGEMHLWRFDALFSALPEDCRLARVMALRAEEISARQDDRERAALAARQALYRIPAPETLFASLRPPGDPADEDAQTYNDTHVYNDTQSTREKGQPAAETARVVPSPERNGSDNGKQL